MSNQETCAFGVMINEMSMGEFEKLQQEIDDFSDKCFEKYRKKLNENVPNQSKIAPKNETLNDLKNRIQCKILERIDNILTWVDLETEFTKNMHYIPSKIESYAKSLEHLNDIYIEEEE